MLFRETDLKGACIIEPEKIADNRGFFARCYCAREFEKHGLNPKVVQCNISHNAKKGTLRGMHMQISPYGEDKLIRCTRGSIYFVIIDMRQNSSSFKKNIGITLDSGNHQMIYVPKGFANGYMTLEDDTELFYQMSEFYTPESAIGYRYNDPAFGIKWPMEVKVISERDRNYPDFE